jgi:AcrR family transcriptional regulator
VAAPLSLLEQSRGDLSELTLRSVATKAGVSAAAPYDHCEDERALLGGIAEDGSLELGSAMASSVDNAKATKVVERVVRAYSRWAKMHPALYRVMFFRALKEARLDSIRPFGAAGALAQRAEHLRGVKRGRSNTGASPQESADVFCDG